MWSKTTEILLKIQNIKIKQKDNCAFCLQGQLKCALLVKHITAH